MSVFVIRINFAFVDDKGKESSTKIDVPTGLTIAAITTFAVDAANILAAWSTCQITRVTACIGIDISGLGLLTAAAATADAEEKAQFLMRTASGTYGRMVLPTIGEAYVLPGSDQLDIADAEVAAFVTALEDGITTAGGNISPCDKWDNDFVECYEQREIFRAS